MIFLSCDSARAYLICKSNCVSFCLLHWQILFKDYTLLLFYLLCKRFGFTTNIPKVSNLYMVFNDTIYDFVQSVHYDAAIGAWEVCQKRLYRPKVWIIAQKFLCAKDIAKKLFAALFAVLDSNVSGCLLHCDFCPREPSYIHTASASCKPSTSSFSRK